MLDVLFKLLAGGKRRDLSAAACLSEQHTQKSQPGARGLCLTGYSWLELFKQWARKSSSCRVCSNYEKNIQKRMKCCGLKAVLLILLVLGVRNWEEESIELPLRNGGSWRPFPKKGTLRISSSWIFVRKLWSPCGGIPAVRWRWIHLTKVKKLSALSFGSSPLSYMDIYVVL